MFKLPRTLGSRPAVQHANARRYTRPQVAPPAAYGPSEAAQLVAAAEKIMRFGGAIRSDVQRFQTLWNRIPQPRLGQLGGPLSVTGTVDARTLVALGKALRPDLG